MFLDEVTLDLAAGSGGRGAVSFRHEKYVPRGGPDGGDGGRGGSIVVAVDIGESTLGRYRQRRRFRAPDGRPGGPANRTGADGADVVIPVPPGTTVTDAESGERLADLTTGGERIVAAAGGAGGRGNARFATPVHRAPRLGELGVPGVTRRIRLELKLIADAGLVGLPNAGKSTLLAALTGARPKIAAYPFTTLHPNLGVAELSGGRVMVIADVPGLIEGAHQGAGLGTGFLRHLERTRILVHVLDCSEGAGAARRALEQVASELGSFSPALAARPVIIALNKVDIPEGRAAAEEMLRELPRAVPVSGVARTGLDRLLDAADHLLAEPRAAAQLAEAPALPAGGAAGAVGGSPHIESAERPLTHSAGPGGEGSGHRLYRYVPSRREPLAVARQGDGTYRVSGAGLEELVRRFDLENDEAVADLRSRLTRRGVDRALAEAGCAEGDTVRIAEHEFTYLEGMGSPGRARADAAGQTSQSRHSRRGRSR
jgi:GTP-binding protein